MKLTLKTVVASLVGATAFAHGTHNVISHPEAGAGMGWYMVILGAFCLLTVAFDVVQQYRLVKRD